MSLAQCTEDVANSCWAWNCNARHCCAKRRAPRCGIGCANASAPCAAPPHTVRRHGPHLGALLHKIRREEGRTGSPKTARAPLPLGGARVPVGAARFANATDMAATARAAPPHPAAAANVPSHTKWRLTLALTLFCRAEPVRRYGRAIAAAACATAAAAVAFANLQNALRGTAAAVPRR